MASQLKFFSFYHIIYNLSELDCSWVTAQTTSFLISNTDLLRKSSCTFLFWSFKSLHWLLFFSKNKKTKIVSYNTLYTLILTWGVVGDSHKKYCIPLTPHPPVRKLTLLQSNIIVCGYRFLWWEYYIYGLIAIIISFIGILLVQFYPFFFGQHSFSFVIWWAGRRAMFSLWRSWPGTITAPSYRRNRPAPTSVLPLFLLSACHAGLTAREKDTTQHREKTQWTSHLRLQ